MTINSLETWAVGLWRNVSSAASESWRRHARTARGRANAIAANGSSRKSTEGRNELKAVSLLTAIIYGNKYEFLYQCRKAFAAWENCENCRRYTISALIRWLCAFLERKRIVSNEWPRTDIASWLDTYVCVYHDYHDCSFHDDSSKALAIWIEPKRLILCFGDMWALRREKLRSFCIRFKRIKGD